LLDGRGDEREHNVVAVAAVVVDAEGVAEVVKVALLARPVKVLLTAPALVLLRLVKVLPGARFGLTRTSSVPPSVTVPAVVRRSYCVPAVAPSSSTWKVAPAGTVTLPVVLARPKGARVLPLAALIALVRVPLSASRPAAMVVAPV
jgi:hypothetical protein